ncbi:MAG: thiamine-phosphate kinase [Pseudomonadota bacterium]
MTGRAARPVDEFSIIRELFAPLTEGQRGAFGLGDDVALADERLVVTKDVLIAGVHFRKDDPLDLVARKVLRVNISDLVAKGAKPRSYLLGCVWPQKTNLQEIEAFTDGLSKDQHEFRCQLIGGDTVRHRTVAGPLTISATFLGEAPADGPILRDGAAPGDDVYVTGTIGDAGLGLLVLNGKLKNEGDQYTALTQRYHLPQPRVMFGTALASFASAAMDVSDGLIADAGHLARQSGVNVMLDLAAMPLSDAAATWLAKQRDEEQARLKLAGFGDDYEILFTASNAMRRGVEMAAKASRTAVTRIGKVKKGAGVDVLNAEGVRVPVETTGFNHFSV